MSVAWKLKTREDIYTTAKGLAAFLEQKNIWDEAISWTDQNFTVLGDFARQIDSEAICFHKPRKGQEQDRKEFLWDFMACRPGGGLSIVGESEADASTPSEVVDLCHDFEKLLYVFAPLRVLITKAKDEDHVDKLIESLSKYANGCSMHFNPGSALILHFRLTKSPSLTYIWQSKGDPASLELEDIKFALLD